MANNFDSWADFYKIKDPGYRVHITSAIIAELISKILPMGETFLESGYGTGYTAIAIANKGKYVIGYDPESGLLDHARLAAKTHMVSDCGHILFTDKKEDIAPVDIVYSQGLLEHFSDAEIIQILNEQLGFARSAVVFSVPTNAYPQIDFGNERLMNIAEWERILAPFSEKLTQLYTYEREQQLMGVIKK